MKIKTPSEQYLKKAKLLTAKEAERLLSRTGGKLRRQQDKEKVSSLEALAIQLELEDEQLREWRERMAAIKAKGKDKAKPVSSIKDKGKPAPSIKGTGN
jgi:hypothetical protein